MEGAMLLLICIGSAWIVCSYFIITTIVDIVLMGRLHFKILSKKSATLQEGYCITKQNRIDMQTGFMCSAYASAYVVGTKMLCQL